MTPLALALSLFLTGQPAAEASAAPPAEAAAPELPPVPTGAPKDDYQLVAWCYGALRGYLEMHDEVMPEVTRIEAEFRKPGTRLEDDLKVYADQMKQGQRDLKRFQAALTAAEKASLQPINQLGAAAVRKGRGVWNAGPDVTPARKAQEWMSWALPARCTVTADALATRAKLMGKAFKVNAEEEEAPAAETPPATEAAPAPETAPAPAQPQG
jgi:hypothetical protein